MRGAHRDEAGGSVAAVGLPGWYVPANQWICLPPLTAPLGASPVAKRPLTHSPSPPRAFLARMPREWPIQGFAEDSQDTQDRPPARPAGGSTCWGGAWERPCPPRPKGVRWGSGITAGVSCNIRCALGGISRERGDATPPQRRTTVPPAGGRSCALGCAGAALGRVPPTTRACGHRGCVLLPSGGLGGAYSTPAGTGGGVFPKWDAHRTTSDHFGLTGVPGGPHQAPLGRTEVNHQSGRCGWKGAVRARAGV